MAVRLSSLIAPVFYQVWRAIKEHKFIQYWLKGGRSSAKSSAISIFIVLLIMQDPEANAICFRKVGDTLRESVFEQLLWAIDVLGVTDEFRCTTSPLVITYKRTGQKILFRGLDKAEKTKSIKLRKGYFKIAWFEELAEFAGMEEVRKAEQSIMRGNKEFVYFYSYNPPITTSNWVNVEAGYDRPDRMVHHSTYLDVPAAWVGRAQLLNIEHLRTHNERAYRHEYLGEATGTGGTVFPNVASMKMTDEFISHFDKICQGIDWGYVNDPFAYVKLHYDKTRRTIYIFDEIYGLGLTNSKAIPLVKAKAETRRYIYADSAEPKSIDEFYYAGIYIAGASKGKGSVEYGLKYLQGLDHIYIDPDRCPNAWREFTSYELEKDKNGEFKSRPPDKNNHCVAEGTLIRTLSGYKPVERVTTEDLVLTRAGFKRVLWSGVTGTNRNVLKLTTSSGKKLFATEDHEVYTENGFKRMDELKTGDVLLEAQCPKYWKHMDELGEDTPNQADVLTGSISKAGANTCTTLCGKSSFARAEKGLCSTIKTVIAKTIPWPIWKKSAQSNIWAKNMLFLMSEKISKENWSNKSVRLQKSGIKARKGTNGTASMLKKAVLETLFTLKEFAGIAARFTSQKHLRLSFVAGNVLQRTEEKAGLIMPYLPVSFAGKNLQETNTQKCDFAAGRVQTVEYAGKRNKVFDLTVEGQHEFIANGILVHNCIDAVSYSLDEYKGLYNAGN